MANTDKTIDLTRIGGFSSRPKISITRDHLAKTMNFIPDFLGVVPIQMGQDTINACYFKDTIAGEGEYYFDLGTIVLPKEFRYVDYDVVKEDEFYSIKINSIEPTDREANLFAPILLNLNNEKKDDKFFHHCTNVTDAGTLESYTREGCIPDNRMAMKKLSKSPSTRIMQKALRDDLPFVLFYYESERELRTYATLDMQDHRLDVPEPKAGVLYKYYMMLLQMSEKNFVYYAIDAQNPNHNVGAKDWETIINDNWLQIKYTEEIDGIGVVHPLRYNDELMVFITSDVKLVPKKPQ